MTSSDPFDSPGKKTPAIHPTSAPPRQDTRPSALRFEHRRHMYFDGKKWLPSVTGIIKRGGEDQSGLFTYYAGKTAECAIREAAEVSRIRRLEGDDEAQAWLAKAPDRHRDTATVSGSDLHDVVDRMQSGAEVPEHLHDNIQKMAEQVIAFLHDYQVQTLYSEVRLAHRSVGYAGTTDLIGIVPQFGEKPIVIDWKTSASMYEKPKYSNGKNAMQLAPYAHAETMFWDDKTEADMIEVNQDVGLIVMVRPEGYKVRDYDIHRAWPQFQRAFEGYWWWRDVDELARDVRPNPPAVEAVEATPAKLKDYCAHTQPACAGCAPDGDPRRPIGPAPAQDPLISQIAEVLDPATFDDLWEANAGIWTDEHTEAVKARIAELGIAS